jgi:uncharacterized protein with von Willebrand factor type A (vWA) domain
MRFRYSRWDGTQDPFAAGVATSEVIDQIGDDVLMGASVEDAVRRLLHRGMPGRFSGIDALRRRLQRQRGREQALVDLAGPLQDIRERLQQVLERERVELSFRDDEDARAREAFLNDLPADAPGRLGELRDYRFADAGAQRLFDELQEHLREQVMGATFRRMAEGMRTMSPDDIARFKDMLAELNGLVEMRGRGESTDAAFDAFMRRHGALFPDEPRTLDELLEAMARRSAAMSSLLASLDADQRQELAALAEQVMQDMDLAFEVTRLEANLRNAFPGMGWEEGSGPGQGAGDGGRSTLPSAVDALERLRDYEELERALEGDYPGAAIDDVDDEAIRRTLGEAAAQDLRRLKQVERLLEEAGVARRSRGRLEITPRGVRSLGERALTQVFEHLQRDREGMHEARDVGGLAEPTGATRPWNFGDHGQLSVQRTVFNAVTRTRRGASVQLVPEDFEVLEAEQRTETATALLLDLSFSMPLRGHFVHAKKLALAMHALIEGRYPHDTLYLVGFNEYAWQLQPRDLAVPGFERVYGTNMQHAFMIANRLLAQHPRATRQAIMVTDGEPTAHLEADQAFFSWPPVPETIERTLAEAMRLSRAGVRLNIFMLEESDGLARFMERLARITKGRVFLMDDDRVGAFVLRDYVAGR